jgi:hypothetical protein
MMEGDTGGRNDESRKGSEGMEVIHMAARSQ